MSTIRPLNFYRMQMKCLSKMTVNEQYVESARTGNVDRIRSLLRRGANAHNEAIRQVLKKASLPRPNTPFWKEIERRIFSRLEKILCLIMDEQKKTDYDNVRDYITPDFVFTIVNEKLIRFRDLLYSYMGDDLVQKTTIDFASQSKVIKKILTLYQTSFSEGDVLLLALACTQYKYIDTWNVIRSFSLKSFERSDDEKKKAREEAVKILKSGRIANTLLPNKISFDVVCGNQKIVRIVKN